MAMRNNNPFIDFLISALLIAALLVAALFRFAHLPLWVAWLIAINAATAFYYTFDKLRATKNGFRVPEKTLLFLGFLGGTPAAFFSMLLLHHKTHKSSFQWRFALVTIIQIVLAYIWFF